MATPREPALEHLLRRAGFGGSPQEVSQALSLGPLAFTTLAARLLNYRSVPDDVDQARSRHPPTLPTHASGGCSGWCTRRGRSRRR
jgi:hypothetical protein